MQEREGGSGKLRSHRRGQPRCPGCVYSVRACPPFSPSSILPASSQVHLLRVLVVGHPTSAREPATQSLMPSRDSVGFCPSLPARALDCRQGYIRISTHFVSYLRASYWPLAKHGMQQSRASPHP